MKIFIDYDTTLVNFITPWLDWVNKKYNRNFTTNEITRWYFLREELGKDADDFWKNEAYNWYLDKEFILPFDGAVEFVNQLQNHFGRENIFIISSTKEHHKTAKLKHMNHHFPVARSNCLLIGKEKYHYTQEGILIDDYPLHVMEHIRYNQKHGIVFNLNHQFGWAKRENFNTDATLLDFLPICNSTFFSIHTHYHTILQELRNE